MSKFTKMISLLSALVLLVCLVPTLAAAAVTEETATVSSVVYNYSNTGFQFQVLPADSLPYDGGWQMIHDFAEGGLYTADGTLLTTNNVVKKLTASLYYISLSERGHSAADGEIFYLDGVIQSGDLRVTFERTYFQYNGDTASWAIVVAPESIEREETVTLKESVSSSATGLYFYVDPADSLPYDGGWNIQHNFETGGLFKLDGTPLNQITVKVQSNLYYMSLKYTPVDGDIIYVDGSIVFDGVRVKYTRAYFQYDADAPEGTTKWAKISTPASEKEEIILDLSALTNDSGANGFYFKASPTDPLEYDSVNWEKRYPFTEGGVYLEDGTLLDSPRTLVKLDTSYYYVGLLDNGHVAVDGEIITVDGVVETDTHRIVFTRTNFQYNESTRRWAQVLEPGAVKEEVEVVLSEVSAATGAGYLYFHALPADPLPYAPDWSVRHVFTKGGVYLKDGTLLNGSRVLVKTGSTAYAVVLSDSGHSAEDGDVVIVDGEVDTPAAKVTFERTAFQFDAETGTWSIIEEIKKETTVSVNVTGDKSGGNGFYFTVSPTDPLPYSDDWKTRYIFNHGGVYKADGTLLASAQTMAKLSENKYYLSLSDCQYVAKDGDVIIVDGAVKTVSDIVTFERTMLRYDGQTSTWSTVANFEGAQVTLSDKLDIDFALTIPSGVAAKNPVLKFTMGDKVTDVTMPEQQADGTYRFILSVSAKDMANTFTAQLMDGSTVINEKTYSIREYGESILKGDYSAEHKAIAKAMLNYGASAQQYFGHLTDDLANKNYAYSDSEWDAVNTDSIPAMTIDGPADGYVGATLLLRSTVGVRLYFTTPVEGGVTSGNYCYYEFDGVKTADFDKVQSVTLNGTTYTFSVLSLAKMVVTGNYRPAYVTLAKSMLLYSDAVEGMLETPLILHQLGTVYPYHDNAKAYLQTADANVSDYINGSADSRRDTVISWVDNAGGATGYTLLLATKADYSDAKIYELEAGVTSLAVNNLFKATKYYVKVTAKGSGHVAEMTFNTTDLGPRVMTVDGMFNVRDIGGYASSLGGTTLQGLIYRGGAVHLIGENYVDGYVKITDEGKRVMSEEMGIRTEIDLRGSVEAGDLTKSLIPGARLVYYTQSGYDTTLINTDSVANVKKTFQTLARPENYPVYIHCTAGADRTGTIVYLINALLGVDEEELIRDYEFTSFSTFGERNAKPTSVPTANPEKFQDLREYVASYPGATLAEKAESYLLSIGVTAAEIANFRAIMTGGETTELPDYTVKTPEDNHLKILAIGNSFSIDATAHMRSILMDGGYDSVTVATAAIGGCTLQTHYGNILNDSASYEYWINERGAWKITENRKLSDILIAEDWDIITVQQASHDSGRPTTYSYLQGILDYLKANEIGNAKILWHMTWAYQQDCLHTGFANYGKDQMTMYNAILNAVDTQVLTQPMVDGVIPAGTAIQNLRTSVLGDTLTRDGFHMSEGIGRYTVGLTWYAYLSGKSASTVDYVPSAFKDEITPYLDLIYAAVDAAIANPYEVTDLS